MLLGGAGAVLGVRVMADQRARQQSEAVEELHARQGPFALEKPE